MSEVFNYFWGSVDVTHPISGDVSWKFTGFEEVFCVYKQVRGTTRCVKSKLVFKLTGSKLTVLERWYHWAPFGNIGYHLGPLVTIWYHRVTFSIIENHLIPLGTNGYQWVPLVAIGYHLVASGKIGYYWVPSGIYRRIPLGTIG